MDKYRIKGNDEQFVREALAKITADKNVAVEGNTDKAVGIVRSTFGVARDRMRELFRKHPIGRTTQ